MNEVYIPKVLLIDPKTGQKCEGILQSDIKPWPTEPEEEESATPMVFNNTVTIEVTKKEAQAFNRMLRRGRKVPRKLKKAIKHIRFSQPVFVVKQNDKYTVVGAELFHTINGYPYTKWVRKAIGKAYYERGIKPPKVYSTLEKYIEESIKQGTL